MKEYTIFTSYSFSLRNGDAGFGNATPVLTCDSGVTFDNPDDIEGLQDLVRARVAGRLPSLAGLSLLYFKILKVTDL